MNFRREKAGEFGNFHLLNFRGFEEDDKIFGTRRSLFDKKSVLQVVSFIDGSKLRKEKL